ncbi:MAG: hypothetical protein COA32_04185 [Fluviicola sp.]|nr:MAG: hypothetical protein COA32_04185 [Fluviicola sp.]
MESKIKILMLVVFATISTLTFSQYSVGGGISTLHGAGIDITRYGLNVYYETPRTEVNTFYIRPTLMLPQKFISNNGSIQTTEEAFNQGVSPSVIDNLRSVEKTTYFSIDGGTRIYFINTYDAGFSLYGGGHLKGIISNYSNEVDLTGLSIDPNNYVVPNTKAYALLFSFGGNFGAKYQLPYRGAIVFDLAIDLISRLYDPAVVLGNEISPLSLSFNLAYRFDWY